MIGPAFASQTITSTAYEQSSSLTSEASFQIIAGTFAVATTVQVDNTFTIRGGILAGATVQPGSGGQGLICTSSGGTLSGVTVNGPLDLTAANAYAGATNGLTLNGTATLGSGAALYFTGGSQTLGGTGTVVFSNQASFQALVAKADNMTLTIRAGITICGGNIWGSEIGYADFPSWGGGSNTSIVNQGTISADTSDAAIVVNPKGTFTNEGTLSASNGGHVRLRADGQRGGGGRERFWEQLVAERQQLRGRSGAFGPVGTTLSFNGTWKNISTITASSATLNLGDQSSNSTNGWSNAGTITATNSTVNLGGLSTSLGLGTFNYTGDSVNLVGTLDNTGTTLVLNGTSWNLMAG